MTAYSVLSNVYEKKIPDDIIRMIIDYVIKPNNTEYFALCIKTACLGMTLAMKGGNYEREWYLRSIKGKKNDERKWIMAYSHDKQYNENETHTLSYIEKVEKSQTLFGFEKLILIQRFHKVKKAYQIKKDMSGGKIYNIPLVLRRGRERIIYKDCGFDVKKTLDNNNVDLDTQQLHSHLMKQILRKGNMKRATEMIKFKYENPDRDIDAQDDYVYVKETEKMVVYEKERGDGKQKRKRKSNIYDFFVKDTHKDTKKEERELKYMCRNINGFADSKYAFIIINENFDYNDSDIRCRLGKINPYHNAWHDNFGQDKYGKN